MAAYFTVHRIAARFTIRATLYETKEEESIVIVIN
jgi:hypothetical protein